MAKIAVTGGSGASGRFVSAHLLRQGHEVFNVDRVRAPGEIRTLEVDLERYGDVVSALMGADAVVHFAANPEPDFDPHTGAERFRGNTVTCFNVFQAAAALGIQRVVWASSETVLGFPFYTNAPVSLPVTEENASQPQNAYAISKVLSEELARHVCRLNPEMTIIGLRLSNILYEADHRDVYAKIPGYWKDLKSRRFNLWSYIDARDVATAVERALEADQRGSRDYIIAADDTIMRQTSHELRDAEFPDVPLAALDFPRQAMISNARAKAELGWAPGYRWSDILLDSDA